MKKRLILLALVCMLIGFSYLNSTIGIGTKFATIVLEKLEPGSVYNLTKLRNLPFIVINSGSSEIEIVVDIEIPLKEELKEGYEPIPDPSWIKIIPNKFRLKPQESYSCDLVISIPNDQRIVGRHFQAKIWAHTAGEELFGAGVVNRIFLSVGTPGPETVQKAKKKELLFSFNFDVDPRDIHLEVPVGKKVNVLKEFDKTIKLINKAKNDVIVKLEIVDKKESGSILTNLPSDYEFISEPNFLIFIQKEIKVKRNSIKDVNFQVYIPDEEIFHNRKFIFLVKVFPIKPELPVDYYIRVFITTRK